MKIAIVHYWLVNMRGGEKVLEALCELYPQADIYTHVYDPAKISPTIRAHKVYTSSVARLPWAKKLYTRYLTFMPKALENINLENYDLIISSESGPAKGIIASSSIPHICYCHSPMRYLWDHYHSYLAQSSLLVAFIFRNTALRLRLWDLATANRVDFFIANSSFVARRIERIYRRDSTIIYPPVAVDDFYLSNQKESYYLFLGHLVGYKRADLAIKAFELNGLPLIIIGQGKLKQKIPANIKILGHVTEEEKKSYLSKAKALIFPGEEDFGIVPVEAIASGTPVIAYGRGGALETIKEGISGLFFTTQTAQALNSAIDLFIDVENQFNGQIMKQSVEHFSSNFFKDKFKNIVNELTKK